MLKGDLEPARAGGRSAAVFAFACTLILLFIAPSVVSAATPTILNTSSTGGQTNWLESFSSAGETNNSGNKVRISLAVKHDPGRRVTGLKIDDDWDGTDNASAKAVKTVTAQQPNIQGGYDHSRVTYEYTFPTSNTGMSCGAFGVGGTNKTTKAIRVRAVLDDGSETATSSSNINFSRTDCTGGEDFPYLYQWSQTATTVNPGGSVSFTFRGDDSDSNGNADFAGVNWRLRRLSDGATTTPVKKCYSSPFDNTDKTLDVTFPSRGRWVVEAELLNNSGCDVNNNAGSWAWIGAVDVNSAAATSPTANLSATRPQIGGNTTVSATFADGADNAQGGRVQNLEWDLDGNTGNGVNGFEVAELGTWNGGLTSPRTRTISTAGMSPGLKTVRARVTDNGALLGADNSRRQSTVSTTFLVDSPPVATSQDVRAVSGEPKEITLAGTDPDGDDLTFGISEQPQSGTVAWSGGKIVYTPESGFAGSDDFEFTAADGYGGTSTGTVTVRVDPDLAITGAPAGTLPGRGTEVAFGSSVDSATFECSFDEGPWNSCQSPKAFTDLTDGDHGLRIRVTAAGLLNPEIESATWSVDASPAVEITEAPAAVTADPDVTVEFTATEAGATVAPSTSCRLDGGGWRPCASPHGYTDLDDGAHRIDVRATDAFGKQTVTGHDWTISSTPPSTEIEQPLPPAITNSRSLEIAFSATDPGSTFECRLDEAEWDSCVSPALHNELADGRHVFRVRAVSELGVPDPLPAAFAWTIDTVAPAAQLLDAPSGRTSQLRPEFDFGASEPGSTFTCGIDTLELTSCTAPFAPAADLTEGDHTFRLEATDRAGNRSPAVVRDFTVDRTPPAVLLAGTPAEGTEFTVDHVNFSFGPAESGATHTCRIDEGEWVACSSPHSVSDLGEGAHRFEVRAADTVGNVSAPAVRGFVVDTIAPETRIEGGPAGQSRSSRAIFALAADEANVRFHCSLDGASFTPCQPRVEFGELADGPHELRARATDHAGNQDPAGAVRHWTVDGSPLAPPDEPVDPGPGPGPEPEPDCVFGADLPSCGSPFLSGTIAGTKKLSLGFEIDSGGAGLSAATLSFPAGAKAMRTGSKLGRGVGSLIITGVTAGPLALKLPPKKSARMLLASRAGTTVKLSTKSLAVAGLPAGTDGLKLKLRSGKALRITVRKCGTSIWKAALSDAAGNRATVSEGVDLTCKKKTGKGGRK